MHSDKSEKNKKEMKGLDILDGVMLETIDLTNNIANKIAKNDQPSSNVDPQPSPGLPVGGSKIEGVINHDAAVKVDHFVGSKYHRCAEVKHPVVRKCLDYCLHAYAVRVAGGNAYYWFFHCLLFLVLLLVGQASPGAKIINAARYIF